MIDRRNSNQWFSSAFSQKSSIQMKFEYIVCMWHCRHKFILLYAQYDHWPSSRWKCSRKGENLLWKLVATCGGKWKQLTMHWKPLTWALKWAMVHQDLMSYRAFSKNWNYRRGEFYDQNYSVYTFDITIFLSFFSDKNKDKLKAAKDKLEKQLKSGIKCHRRR